MLHADALLVHVGGSLGSQKAGAVRHVENKVLVACEKSQAVTIALRARGVEAYSCDIDPCTGERPEWHLQQDVTPLLKERWEMVIAFPPCTHLCVSGARYFKDKRQDGRQDRAIDFFMQFARLPKYCIENPIGIMSTVWRKPDQIIQPWQFGHGETKATCLWLRGLPPLRPTNVVPGRKQAVWKMGPSADRSEKRAITYTGIAEAIAEQWTKGVEQLTIWEDYEGVAIEQNN